MKDADSLDSRTLTFSQANGYEELPQPLALGKISDDARRKLWDLLWLSAWRRPNSYQLRLVSAWFEIFKTTHSEFLRRPADEYHGDPSRLLEHYKTMVLWNLPLHRLFDLWQMFLRHKHCPSIFIEDTASVFRQCQLAYVVDTNGSPTILPASTPQEGEALKDALRRLREGNYEGAKTHLREAGAQVNAGEWAESVRESIHAVESVARKLDPKHANTLDSALKSLEKQIRIHPALKNAFSRLYGYTSDEDGVRHALLEDSASPVGRDEAVFMLGACASFVSYLLSKSRGGTAE